MTQVGYGENVTFVAQLSRLPIIPVAIGGLKGHRWGIRGENGRYIRGGVDAKHFSNPVAPDIWHFQYAPGAAGPLGRAVCIPPGLDCLQGVNSSKQGPSLIDSCQERGTRS